MPVNSGTPNSAEWIEKHALPDAAIGDAYDTVPSREKAILKKCIARLHRLWGEAPLRSRCSRRLARDFSVEQDEQAVPYALVACDVASSQPAALLAAVVPAVLAGVRKIIPCFVDSSATAQPETPSPSLLAALELAGVETMCSASMSAAENLLRMLDKECAQGRLIVLGPPPFGRELALLAHENGLVCRFLTGPLLYYSQRLHRNVAQAFGRSPSEQGADNAPDGPEEESAHVFLHLDEAHEDVWVWPDLSPDWFRSRHLRLFSV